MRILHLCLACFYIDNYNYQENVLPRISKEKGREVKIIASTETFLDNRRLGYTDPGSYITEYGVPIVRLPYKKVLSDRLSAKLRFYKGLYKEIESFKPDIIFSHDLSFCSLPIVVKYLRENPKVCFLADTHTAYYNSGRNWISLNLLHKMIYKPIIKKAIPYLKKYYYIAPAERDFSTEVYNIPKSIMEYLPLGGVIPDESEKEKLRVKYRKELGMTDEEFLFIHSGKLDELKKTVMLLKAFSANKILKAKMVIIGSIADSIKDDVMALINGDKRIEYLGWKDSEVLLDYLCASDLYCQPGSPSATLQNAICCGSAVMAMPMEGYKMLDEGNFVWVDSEESIENAFSNISEGKINIEVLKRNSVISAKKYLNYEDMEQRIINQFNE